MNAGAEAVVAARRWVISGRVQGVGFRPFVYRLAHEYGLHGWVSNGMGGVEVVAEGAPAVLCAFGRDLLRRAPPLALLSAVEEQSIPPPASGGFQIRDSAQPRGAAAQIPPDQSMCADCLAEIKDPTARRHQYPFTNCTQCGPRYTIIRALPYDRHHTSLAGFALCADCAAEYADPRDRRFHAQPLACPGCGPRLQWRTGSIAIEEGPAALAACVAALRAGRIVAVRGVGGYHLMCDAANAATVRELRARKRRPDKPLAVMVPASGVDGLGHVHRLAVVGSNEAAALLAAARPIVLVRRRPDAPIAAGIAPQVDELGVMLPYSPLHHVLLEGFGGPLVATSANVSGEPVLTEPRDVEARLASVADACLHHDRPILRPADDPVVRWVAGRIRPLRLGRGTAPLELRLHRPVERPLLALGAYSKATVALAWDDRVIVSPHIGNLSAPRTRRLLHEVAADLQALYGVRAECVACDAHPDFPTHRWARDCGLPVTNVYHHHAHASAVAGEFAVRDSMLCFTWDGVGYGEDGTLWGGEALWGLPGRWRRVASWRPFKLPGGARAAQQPWRIALGLCWLTERRWPAAPPGIDPLLHRAFDTGLGMPLTSAVGRLFDAAAALLGLVADSSFESQAALRLETLAHGIARAPVDLPLEADRWGILRSDWEPLLAALLDDSSSVAERAAVFHASLARALVNQAVALRDDLPFNHVGLAGGVFQNRLLSRAAQTALQAHGFDVLIPLQLPLNDAGISFGQIVEAAAREAAA